MTDKNDDPQDLSQPELGQALRELIIKELRSAKSESSKLTAEQTAIAKEYEGRKNQLAGPNPKQLTDAEKAVAVPEEFSTVPEWAKQRATE